MPKLERLDWIAPLSEGRGITLSNDPEADLFLAEDPNALMIGVLLDSQYPTRIAFAAPLKLRRRLGHLDLTIISTIPEDELTVVFREKPALHRFPAKFAKLTQQLASHLVERYNGDSSRIWNESRDVDDLGTRILALPAFGEQKANWTVGMLGTLGMLGFDGWQEYRAPEPRKKRAESAS